MNLRRNTHPCTRAIPSCVPSVPLTILPFEEDPGRPQDRMMVYRSGWSDVTWLWIQLHSYSRHEAVLACVRGAQLERLDSSSSHPDGLWSLYRLSNLIAVASDVGKGHSYVLISIRTQASATRGTLVAHMGWKADAFSRPEHGIVQLRVSSLEGNPPDSFLRPDPVT